MIYKMDNSYYVLKDMVPKLRKYGEAIVKEFGMKERFFHIEFFRGGTIILPLSTITALQVVSPLMFITLLIPWTSIVDMQPLSQEKSSQRQSLNLSIVWLHHVVQMLTMSILRRTYLPNIASSSRLKKNHARGFCGTSRRLLLYADNSESTRNGSDDC